LLNKGAFTASAKFSDMKFYELEVGQGGRPEHPEDWTVIIEADCIADALDRYKQMVSYGHVNSKGDVKKCREIYYVYSDSKYLEFIKKHK